MSTDFLDHGRVQQKQRTHTALIAAARELLAAGRTPTVEEAAEVAAVSRTTAYRYSPNPAALLMAAHPEHELRSLLRTDSEDVATRVDDVVDGVIEMILAAEREQRATLRVSLELEPEQRRQLPLRQGRVIGWLEEALAPAEPDLGPAGIAALARAVRSAIGIEALVWLTDVAGLDRDEAGALMRWSAQAMTRAALDGDPPPTGRRSRRR